MILEKKKEKRTKSVVNKVRYFNFKVFLTIDLHENEAGLYKCFYKGFDWNKAKIGIKLKFSRVFENIKEWIKSENILQKH